MSSHGDLKTAMRRLSECRAQITETRIKYDSLARTLDSLNSEAVRLQEQIDRIKREAVVAITEHAILQYITRVYQVDIEATKKAILPEDQVLNVCQLGDGEYPVGDTHTVVVRDGVVTTVLVKDRPTKKQG